MRLFYNPHLASKISHFPLETEEAHHALRVLRMREGDELAVTNGKGLLVKGHIHSIHGKDVAIAADEEEQHPQPQPVHVALSPTKNASRIEWLVEKATEVGAASVTFMECERTERSKLRLDRLHRITLEAMKQSQQYWLPQVQGLVPFQEVVEQAQAPHRYIAWCETGAEELMVQHYPGGTEVLLLIGPEGDFTAEEVALAQKHDFRPVSLGPTRLRTETAALAALLQAQTKNLL